MLKSAAPAQAVTDDSNVPRGFTVAHGISATPDDTAFVHASAEYPTDQNAVAIEWAPAASAGIAKSVGIAAYAKTGMVATFDNIDNNGSDQNAAAVTGTVATVAARVATAVSFKERDFGTNDRFSEIFGATADIPRVAANERRNDASDAVCGFQRTVPAATAKRVGTASALNAGSQSVATVDMNAARMTGIPLPARAAYPQIPQRRKAVLVKNGSRLASTASIHPTTATFPPLATTRCDNPLVRYPAYSSSDIPVPSPKRIPLARPASFLGKIRSVMLPSQERVSDMESGCGVLMVTTSARISGSVVFRPVATFFLHSVISTSSPWERRSTDA